MYVLGWLAPAAVHATMSSLLLEPELAQLKLTQMYLLMLHYTSKCNADILGVILRGRIAAAY